MRKLLCFTLLFSSFILSAQNLTTIFEQSNGKQTPTYFQAIDWWKKTDAVSPIVKMQAMETTDAGYPLHLILVSQDRDFDINSIKTKRKNIILINNGIHPGEPDGIDASMLMVKDIIQKKYPLPVNVVLAIIPVYNIGGTLNRSSNYRVDQNGPEEFGFAATLRTLTLTAILLKPIQKMRLHLPRFFTI
jgi:hypothetical protein